MYTVDISTATPRDSAIRDIEQGVDAMAIPRRRTLRSFFTALMILPLFGGAAYALDNGQCLDCHGDSAILGWSPAEKASNVTPGGAKRLDSPFGKFPGMSLHVDSAAYKASVHADVSCTDCHADIKTLPHTARLKRVDCSGSHSEVTAAYSKSRHVVAADRKPVVNGPTCADCHAAEKLAARYGLSGDKVRGYEQSHHGLSARMGDKTVANCSSCHGVHEIFPSSDPRSTIHPKNLPVTCGKCHPGATANFASGNIHVGPGGTGGMIKAWVERIYIWLIVVVIGGMLVHNGFDYFRKMQALYRRRREWEHPGYERLSRSERVQHTLTFTTFFALVVTGFALKFKWSLPLVADQTSAFLRGWGHRAAAVLMIATAVYHLFYAVFTARGRGQIVRMLPCWKDAEDVAGTIRYYLGLADHKPKFDRFSYVEKAEYLALVWGTIVMVVTGFLLWFRNEALKHLPMWGLDVATLVHYYEAILATLAIFVWHLYSVIVNPDFAPMSFTWIDGKLSRHDMEHEHAIELEEIDAYVRGGETPPPDVTRIAPEEE